MSTATYTELKIIRRPMTSYKKYYLNSATAAMGTIDTDTQYRRLTRLRTECQKRIASGKKLSNLGTRDFVISKHYRFLYCPVAKVAEANWKRVIMVLEGTANTTQELHHSRVLGKDGRFYQTIKDAGKEFDDFVKFLFVRHPFKRLLSAYRNKFENPDEWGLIYPKNYGRSIIKKYRPKATNSSLQTGNDVTFSEFVKYVLDESDREPEGLNMHWLPMYLSCDVCSRRFNFIGKFETLHNDAKHLLQKIHATNVVEFPESESCATHVTNSSKEETYHSYFKELTQGEIRKLYKLYRPDFKMFGYNFPYELLDNKNNSSAS
ncbi:carbohydrate sulfotransferase 8-like [Saccoglossus kowalevskii]|uniref:Carbohydrate sulfotransferase n=1 Tax=Saccoglossus kowalevskii TaxID=10224 RepID=A0ABM0MUW1_SACKO|nr:PREDICTED: carbohydrate sulfotransferase 8-like [Saccoglossus kowalevskii]